ncbi:MAG: hypothetical protein JAZ15_21685 [Candidatus Thiodiazotropha endolucinida]|nr:hypothetical protein [Candidatus Thiodiazotropha taylori]MCW4315629.1 hypothetical protein [Candidatus Thiodiazotropha taylori]
MNLRRTTIIRAPVNYKREDREAAKAVLVSRGFVNVHLCENNICAERGSNLATMLVPGDARRWFHRITIADNEIQYIVNTWYSVFNKTDEGVFLAEANTIESEINGEKAESGLIEKANKRRLISDISSILMLIVFIFAVFVVISLI